MDDRHVAAETAGATFILTGIAGTAFYLLLAGRFSFDELTAAAVCGLIAALWSARLRRVASTRFRFGKESLAATARALGGLPTAVAQVAFVLSRTVLAGHPAGAGPGESVRQPFVHGRLDPANAGRRAITVLARSLAPDSFVVRVPEGRNEIEVHQLVKPPTPKDARGAI